MKGKKCIKYLILCITCLLSLSHYLDASALTITADGTPTGVKYNFNDVYYYYTSNEGQTWTLDNQQKGNLRWMETNSSGQRRFLHAIRPNKQIHITKDYYYALEFAYQWSWLGDQNAFHEIFIYSHYANPNDFNVMSWEQGECHSNTSYDPSTTSANSAFYAENTQIYTCYDYIVLQATHDGDVYFQLGSGNALFAVALTPFRGTFRIGEIMELKPTVDGAQELNEKDDQDRQDIEQQSSSTEQSADTASEDVGGATTNIIGAINGFATAVTNIQAGTCILPEISAYGMNLGRLNLCTYSPPAWVQGLTSTILSLITLKMAINIFYRIMGLLDGVLGGKK